MSRDASSTRYTAAPRTPRRLAFVERWESAESLQANLESDHVQAVLARAPELFDGDGDIVVYEALPEASA